MSEVRFNGGILVVDGTWMGKVGGSGGLMGSGGGTRASQSSERGKASESGNGGGVEFESAVAVRGRR